MDCSTPGLPVHHQLPEVIQTHGHWVSDAFQPSHPLLSPSPPTFNLSHRQGLFKWASSSIGSCKWVWQAKSKALTERNSSEASRENESLVFSSFQRLPEFLGSRSPPSNLYHCNLCFCYHISFWFWPFCLPLGWTLMIILGHSDNPRYPSTSSFLA